MRLGTGVHDRHDAEHVGAHPVRPASVAEVRLGPSLSHFVDQSQFLVGRLPRTGPLDLCQCILHSSADACSAKDPNRPGSGPKRQLRVQMRVLDCGAAVTYRLVQLSLVWIGMSKSGDRQ